MTAVRIPMLCRCGGGGGNPEEADAFLARAYKALHCDASNFTSHFTMALWNGFDPGFEWSVECDQWFGVYAKKYDDKYSTVVVECDLAEDGMAAILCWLIDNVGWNDDTTYGEGLQDPDEQVQ